MFPQIKTILYTTALGPHTRPVFRFAVSLAKQINARIVLAACGRATEPLDSVLAGFLSALGNRG
jgi:hypothetical protein